MTREIKNILSAYTEAKKQGRQTALATVVCVEGSSYRRPGARMLIEENGRLTGAISGGCLEGDVFRKACFAMNQKQNKLIKYDTTLDDDLEFGMQLGCNGIVYILLEPIDAQQRNNPIALLERSVLHRKNSVLVTLFSLKVYSNNQPGTCLFFNADCYQGTIDDENLESEIMEDAARVLASESSILKTYRVNELSAFVEFVEPPVSLIIVGAGNDAFPLVEIASVLGWQITVVDGRSTHATKQRFANVHKVIVGKPVDIMRELVIDDRTFFVLMTHNYNYDLSMMAQLLKESYRYIGILGPRKRLHRLLTELQDSGIPISSKQMLTIYGPIGLDIGAEGAEEIALAIVAEIKAVLTERSGSSLRKRIEAIHTHSPFNT